jgi:hypothetical protein
MTVPLAAAFLIGFAADVLEVGPGRTHARPEDALRRARPGDTLLVHPPPGGAYEKVALAVRIPRLTIRAAPSRDGRRVRLDGADFEYSGASPVPRAIVQFDPEANGGLLEGFELTNAHNRSSNGAGVRIAAANDVTIRNCEIHRNDMGIQSHGDVAKDTGRNQRLESCVFHHNGNDRRAGFNHNLYLGGTSVRMTGCEVYAPTTGHNFKSRAHFNWIEASFIHDSGNREFDLVDGAANTEAPGSHAVLTGNVIAKAKDCKGNPAVIHFGQDVGQDHQGTLFLIHNTIVQPFASPVVDLSAPGASAVIANNLVWNGGARPAQPTALAAVRNGAALDRVTGGGNWVSAGFMFPPGAGLAPADNVIASASEAPAFRNPGGADYQLLPVPGRMLNLGRPLVALKLPAAPGDLNPPATLLQFKPPLGAEPRVFAGGPDAGAYEAK